MKVFGENVFLLCDIVDQRSLQKVNFRITEHGNVRDFELLISCARARATDNVLLRHESLAQEEILWESPVYQLLVRVI